MGQERGGQMAVCPPGFEAPVSDVVITQDGDRLIPSPVAEQTDSQES
jgi:virulence-associated protein VagC